MSNEQKYMYDYNGNMTSKNTHIYYDNYSPDEHFHTEYENTTRDYGYNLQNKMERYDEKDQTATYVYDGTGTRIGKTVNGVSTGQIWNNGNVIAEYGTKGTKTYIRGAGGEIVKTKDSANNNRYFSYNAHGDTTNIIEKNAESTSFAVTAAYEYDAFGGLVSGTGGEADSNAFRYNGQYTDEETGLIYLRNRYYDPSIGRFTQEDPYWNPGNMIYGDSGNNMPSYESIVQSANLYVYCVNDPINYIDPFGGDSYIIYDINGTSGDGNHTFYDEAMIRAQQLEETWGTPVYVIGVSSAREFQEVWNYRVGYDWDGYDVPIDEVVIIAHGSIEGGDVNQSYMYFGDKESKIFAYTNVGDSNDLTVWNLAWKEMQYLNFSTCNSGNPDVYNLAYAFKLRMTINQYIIAWDGGTIFNYDTGQLEAGGYDGWWKEPVRQTTWYIYVEKNWYGHPLRERIGFRCIPGW